MHKARITKIQQHLPKRLECVVIKMSVPIYSGLCPVRMPSPATPNEIESSKAVILTNNNIQYHDRITHRINTIGKSRIFSLQNLRSELLPYMQAR